MVSLRLLAEDYAKVRSENKQESSQELARSGGVLGGAAA